jgi:hypothetical protein
MQALYAASASLGEKSLFPSAVPEIIHVAVQVTASSSSGMSAKC